MRLMGQSTRKIFIQTGEESLFKGIERAGRMARVTKSLRDGVIALLPRPSEKPRRMRLMFAVYAPNHRCSDALCHQPSAASKHDWKQTREDDCYRHRLRPDTKHCSFCIVSAITSLVSALRAASLHLRRFADKRA